MTRGSHGKASYYPWRFPAESFPKREEVLKATYEVIADKWVGAYDGYYYHHPKKYLPLLRPGADSSGREAPNPNLLGPGGPGGGRIRGS